MPGEVGPFDLFNFQPLQITNLFSNLKVSLAGLANEISLAEIFQTRYLSHFSCIPGLFLLPLVTLINLFDFYNNFFFNRHWSGVPDSWRYNLFAQSMPKRVNWALFTFPFLVFTDQVYQMACDRDLFGHKVRRKETWLLLKDERSNFRLFPFHLFLSVPDGMRLCLKIQKTEKKWQIKKKTNPFSKFALFPSKIFSRSCSEIFRPSIWLFPGFPCSICWWLIEIPSVNRLLIFGVPSNE